MSDTKHINSRNEEHSMVLRTEGLVKRYGKRTVVNDVSSWYQKDSVWQT